VTREAFRILKPGGTALLSVLPFEVRTRSIRHRPYLVYLRLLRRLRRTRRPDQLLPRLRMRGRLNPGALRDAGPHVYWYRAEEIEGELRAAGFEVEAIGSTPQAVSGDMRGSAIALRDERLQGTLYVVCRRPASNAATRQPATRTRRR
jgi:hypothetical protein